MEIAEITSNDLPEITTLTPEGWRDVTEYFQFYIDRPFCKAIKVVVNNKIIGVGATIAHANSAWLAHIIVRPENRSGGVGNFIMKALLEYLETTQCKSVHLIATPLGIPLYKKFGFSVDVDYAFYKNEAYVNETTNSASVMPCTTVHFDLILSLDKRVSGEDRDALLTPHLNSAKCIFKNDELTGFYLPTLGEGLVVSDRKDVGIELLKERLADKNIVVLPTTNEDGIDYLKDKKFVHFQTGTRMSLGNKVSFDGKFIYSRIGGNLG